MIRSSYRLHGTLATNESAPDDLFGDDAPLSGDIAWACVVYSMVPYLGVLFILPAFAAIIYGSLSPVVNRQRNLSMMTAAAIFILAAQIILWWLLYLIPKIGI